MRGTSLCTSPGDAKGEGLACRPRTPKGYLAHLDKTRGTRDKKTSVCDDTCEGAYRQVLDWIVSSSVQLKQFGFVLSTLILWHKFPIIWADNLSIRYIYIYIYSAMLVLMCHTWKWMENQPKPFHCTLSYTLFTLYFHPAHITTVFIIHCCGLI